MIQLAHQTKSWPYETNKDLGDNLRSFYLSGLNAYEDRAATQRYLSSHQDVLSRYITGQLMLMHQRRMIPMSDSMPQNLTWRGKEHLGRGVLT